MKKTQDFKTQDARKQEEKSEDKNFDFRTQSEPVQKFDKRHGANFLVQPLNRIKLDSLAVKRSQNPSLNHPRIFRKVMKSKHLFLPILALCLTADSSNAATIVYNFTGSNTTDATNGASRTAVATSNDFANSITASVWTLTAAGATVVSIDQSTNGNAASIGAAARVSKRSNAGTHTFSVTIPNTATVDFTNLSFRFGSFGADTTALVPNLLALSISNGGSASQTSFSQAIAGSNTAGQWTDYSVNLTGLLGETNTTVTFTFVDNSQGNNSSLENQFTFIGTVTLTGTVIPEPGAAVLGSLGMLCLLRRRRA